MGVFVSVEDGSPELNLRGHHDRRGDLVISGAGGPGHRGVSKDAVFTLYPGGSCEGHQLGLFPTEYPTTVQTSWVPASKERIIILAGSGSNESIPIKRPRDDDNGRLPEGTGRR